jgi:hypothetical protein
VFEFPLKWFEAGKTKGLHSGNTNLIKVKTKFTGHLLEMEDANFHHDSAVLLPEKESKTPGSPTQDKITGLGVLAACYRHAEEHPDQKMLITGHTDTTGDENYNLILSRKRADNVMFALLGDRGRWVGSSNAKNKVEDYKSILSWAAKGWGWNCDPGEKNNTHDAKTRSAVSEFQKRYNQDFNASIAVDCVVGPETWGAFFDLYMLHLEKILNTDRAGRVSFQSKLKFLDKTRPGVGCGESFPIEAPRRNEYRSATNRRVEILFFDLGEEPLLRCHPNPDSCVHAKCDLYSPELYRFVHVPAMVKPKLGTTWPVTIRGNLFWNRTWDYNDHKKPIPGVKEYLPGVSILLCVQEKGAGSLKSLKSAFLSDDGRFEFTDVPECTKAALRISLEHRDNKVVVIKGKSDDVVDADFEIRKGKVIWHQFDLDVSKLDGKKKEVDFSDLEIAKPHFVEICDAYKSVWLGHKRIKDMTEYDLPLCQVNYPEPVTSTSNASVQMNLLKDDLKDRDVILHEYGHFIGQHILGGLVHPGYGYNDDASGQHGRDTKEHYEAAWNEGHATFLSCAITDDAHYHDGYDTDLSYHLDTDNTTIGPHSEGSIQEALWRIYKVHKTDFKNGFWLAFTDRSKRTVRTIFDFFDNWKDLGIPDIEKVVEAFKKFNMQYGYHYLDGAGRFVAVAAPKLFDKAKQTFRTTNELYDNFGKVGKGTLPDYSEEFYNRNKHFNGGSLAVGSTIATPLVTTGKAYIVPERFEIKS